MIKFGVKKLITLLIVVLSTVVVSVASVLLFKHFNEPKEDSPAIEVSAWSGSGTSDAPYLLTSISDISTLSTNIANGNNYYGVYFKLTTDLDYSGVSNFVPIGAKMDDSNNKITDFDSFCGIFDGDGHIVSNLTTTVSAGISYNEYVGFFAAIGSCRDTSIVYDGELTYEGNKIMLTDHTRVATVKNLKIQNFTVNCNSNSLYIGGIAGVSITESGTANIGSDGLPETNSYKNRTSWSYKYTTLIDQCIVEGLTVNCNNNYVHVSGLVGENWTKEGGDAYSETLGYAPGSLNITNCMVLDFDVTNYWYSYKDGKETITTKGIITTIGPSYANSGVTYGGAFAYYYNISNCVTDNSMFYTVNGSCMALSIYGNEGDYACNEDMHESYKASGKETVSHIYHNMKQAYNYFGWNGESNVSTSYDKTITWYVNEDEYCVYLQQFLIPLKFKSSNESYGTATIDGYSYDEYLKYRDPPVVPRGANDNLNLATLQLFSFYNADDYERDGNYQWIATSLYLYSVYEVEATPTDSSKYKFINWTVSETSTEVVYTANFQQLITYVNLTFEAASGTDKTTQSTYQIPKGHQVKVDLTTTLSKSGAYTTCTFTFTVNSVKTTITYNLLSSNKTQYISGYKKDSTSYTSSSNLTITSNTTFSVVLADRTYNATFS